MHDLMINQLLGVRRHSMPSKIRRAGAGYLGDQRQWLCAQGRILRHTAANHAVDPLGHQVYQSVAAIVHNAGILPMANIAREHLESFDQCVAVNLRSTFLLMGHAREQLSEGGRFVALSSSVLARNFPGYGPYIAAKAGVEGLIRVFANELRGRQITANAVAPGPVATELFFKGKTPEQIAQLAAMNPLERLGEPEDIANTVAFLCSQDGGWVNGQVLRANGGFA